MTVMAEIKRFPLPETDQPRTYISLISLILTVVFAVGSAILAAGVFFGRDETDISNLTQQVSRTVSGIDGLRDAIAATNQRQAVQSNQIDTLKQSIQDDHRELIELERRLVK